ADRLPPQPRIRNAQPEQGLSAIISAVRREKNELWYACQRRFSPSRFRTAHHRSVGTAHEAQFARELQESQNRRQRDRPGRHMRKIELKQQYRASMNAGRRYDVRW